MKPAACILHILQCSCICLLFSLATVSAQDPQPEAADTSAPQSGDPAAAPPPGTTAEQTAVNERYRPLLERSPFLTREYLAQQRQSRSRGAGDILFHGFVQIDQASWLFSIQDRRNQASHWLKIGDSIRDITMEKFDPATRRLTVKVGDVSTELSIVQTEN